MYAEGLNMGKERQKLALENAITTLTELAKIA